VVPIVIAFQSLILDMSGNGGTQSLAVTIRVLTDEQLSGADKFKFILKELRVGFVDGLILGSAAFLLVGLYIHFLKSEPWGYSFTVSGCVGISLMTAMIISSLLGTLIPMTFKKLKIDPAVASGPFITTINDLVAVVTYYGLSWLLLVQLLGIRG
jgi:magnesium transporter